MRVAQLGVAAAVAGGADGVAPAGVPVSADAVACAACVVFVVVASVAFAAAAVASVVGDAEVFTGGDGVTSTKAELEEIIADVFCGFAGRRNGQKLDERTGAGGRARFQR